MRNIIFIFILLFVFCNHTFAQTPIANGKLFLCDDNVLIRTNNNSLISLKKVRKRFNNIIQRNLAILMTGDLTEKQFKKIKKIIRNAKKGRKDAKKCTTGQLPLPIYYGTWSLVSENGQPINEIDINSLLLTFSGSGFTSNLDGTSLYCQWTGSYEFNQSLTSMTQTTLTSNAILGCSSAVNQTRTAIVEFSDDNNTLTLDYRPDGALQVYNRSIL